MNKDRNRNSEMYSSQKGNEWHFGVKAYVRVDADSGVVVHTVAAWLSSKVACGRGPSPFSLRILALMPDSQNCPS